MVPDWREVLKEAQRRIDLSNIAQGAAAGLGATFAIGGMEWSSLASHYPLVLIPFATSIVLVLGSPDAEPAQPRALVGGHLVATLVGFVVQSLGRGRRGRVGGARDVSYRHVPSARRNQPAPGRIRKPSL